MKRWIAVVLVLTIAASLVACGGNGDIQASLVEQLTAAGYDVEVVDAERFFLDAPRSQIFLDGDKAAELSVYVYQSERQAEQDLGHVASDGFGYDKGNNALQVGWVDVPWFFHRDNTVVLYVGSDDVLLTLLEDCMGPAVIYGPTE